MSAHSVAKRYKGLLTETPTSPVGTGAARPCPFLGAGRKWLVEGQTDAIAPERKSLKAPELR
jgi:hypothetical protein